MASPDVGINTAQEHIQPSLGLLRAFWDESVTKFVNCYQLALLTDAPIVFLGSKKAMHEYDRSLRGINRVDLVKIVSQRQSRCGVASLRYCFVEWYRPQHTC